MPPSLGSRGHSHPWGFLPSLWGLSPHLLLLAPPTPIHERHRDFREAGVKLTMPGCILETHSLQLESQCANQTKLEAEACILETSQCLGSPSVFKHCPPL